MVVHVIALRCLSAYTAPAGCRNGKADHLGVIQLEGKYSDKSIGKSTKTYARQFQRASLNLTRIRIPGFSAWPLEFHVYLTQQISVLLMSFRRPGLTLTQTWNTANALETKVELADSVAKGLKAEGIFSFLPTNQNTGAKVNLHFKQAAFHGRAFFDLLKGPTANVDAVIGQDGFLAGASAGYDVQKAALTGYSAAVGYIAPTYSAAVTATNNLSIFAASYYHKVNSNVEAGAKATWDSKSGSKVGLEVASKYRLDPVSFAKVRIPLTPGLAFSASQKCILTNKTAQDKRPRGCGYFLQRPSPTGGYPGYWCFLRHPEA